MSGSGLDRVELTIKQDGMDLRSRLRAATAVEHRRLEEALDLLTPPFSRERFVQALARFWGFHTVWEAGLRRHPDITAIVRERSKLPQLRADLANLGLTPQAIDALPRCVQADTLTVSAQRAAGSLYVIEGSTLGGQLIARALAAEAWAPPGGLSYFTPYGVETGARWRGFQAWLETQSSPTADAEIEAGAVETFRVLRQWMALEGAA